MQPFYGRHFLSGDEIVEVCHKYLALPVSTGSSVPEWEQKVRILAGRPL